MNQTCRLCGSEAHFFHQDKQTYFRCTTCKAIFTSKDELPDQSSEKERYELHDTEIDEGYKKFVSPITSNVLKDFSQDAKGLDFGSGRSEVVFKVLQAYGYETKNYDPFFANDTQLLKERYDYITSCEVIEHFYNPKKEFELLNSMLKEGGRLYLMTKLYDDSIDFNSWYYKNDPTHVFFYTKETFGWIQQTYKYRSLRIDKGLIILTS